MSGQGTGKIGLWSSSRLKSSARLPSSNQADVNITTVYNLFLTPSAHGHQNLLIPANSLYSTAKESLTVNCDTEMDVMEGKGNQPICDSQVIWEITKDLRYP